MRLSRIIIALAAGLTVVAAPTAAGAAQPVTPQPTPTTTSVTQPTGAPTMVPTMPTEIPPGQTLPPGASYQPQQPLLSLNRTTITLGQQVILRGRGWLPNETVEISVAARPPADEVPDIVVRANRAGNFTVRYTPTSTGVLTFTARGQRSGLVDTAVLTVLPRQSRVAQDSGLPKTGDTMGSMLTFGGGLVVFGAMLLLTGVAWRRRRQS